MNNKAGVANHLSHRLAGLHIEHRLHRRLALEVDVLHTIGVEILIKQHLISHRIAVNSAEQYVSIFADLPVFARVFEGRHD